MSENRKCFTFIWKIKNFNFCLGISEIHSPHFFAHVMGGTKWTLYVYLDDRNFEGCVICYIGRVADDSGPDKLELDYELSFLAGDGSVLHSELFLKKLYKRLYVDGSAALLAKKDEVFLHKKGLYMPDDTLTIRCRMWNSQIPISLSERCFAETSVKTQCQSFVGTIEKFGNLEPWGIYPICIILSREIFFSSVNLCVAAHGNLVIKMELVSQTSISVYKYKIFILDIFGNKMKCGESEFHNSILHCVPLTLSKEHLMENKRYYFPNDLLTIEFEIIFHTAKKIEKSDKKEYSFDFQDTQEELHSENFTTLKDDLNSLFRDSVLCDVKLKTATETFPAHIAVLSARSSVFKSMFTTDMKEKTKKCVDIDDLGADTVRRMILFMYTDTLDDLEYQSAKNLYFAADKYNVFLLRHRCSNFLKQNILLENCCDILFLADEHQDKDLKNAIQDYIAENDEAVLLSDEWKYLEKNHPQLTLEVFYAVYMKNRRNK